MAVITDNWKFAIVDRRESWSSVLTNLDDELFDFCLDIYVVHRH